MRSNSGEFIREALLAGLGLGLRSTWDIGPELKSGELKVVLPQYRGSSNVAIYAVYPCREFMPAKVNVFIEFLAELYGTGALLGQGLGPRKLAPERAARKAAARRIGKASSSAVPAR